MTIIAVIPTHNDEVYLRDIIRNARSYVDDIIVVDDASEDATSFIANNMDVKLICNEKHMGKAETLKIGFKNAMDLEPNIIITMYANGLHNPHDIPKLLEPILSLQAEIVIGEYNDLSTNSSIDADNSLLSDTKTVTDMHKGFMAFSSKFFKFNKNILSLEQSFINDATHTEFNIKNVPTTNFIENEHLLYEYKIAAVIPAYNEQLLIRATVEGVPDYISRIFVINDASIDNTAQILESIKDPRLYVITHKVNQGVGAAILHGYKHSLKENMDIAVVLGGDNQMNPAQLPKLIMPIINNEADYTKGNRLFSKELRVGMSQWRFFGNWMLTFINKIASGYWHIMDPQNGFTAISKKALIGMELDTLFTYYGYCNDILVKLNTFGYRTMDIVMPSRYGNEKSSIKYGKFIFRVSFMLFKKFLWRLKMKYIILNFNPLIFFYALGMIILPITLLFTFYLFTTKFLLGWTVSPTSIILNMILWITGIQFIIFAMLFDMKESDKCIREKQ